MNKISDKNKKKLFTIIAAIGALLLGLCALLYFLNKPSNVGQRTIPATTQKTNSHSASSSGSSTDKNTPETDVNSTTEPSATIILSSPPSGSFVSNHKPSLSGTTVPKEEESTCVTVPGASCTIKFIKSDGSIKELTAQTAPQNGVIIWNWDVKSAGFTEGEWTIEATAYSGEKSMSNTDSIRLTVLP